MYSRVKFKNLFTYTHPSYRFFLPPPPPPPPLPVVEEESVVRRTVKIESPT